MSKRKAFDIYSICRHIIYVSVCLIAAEPGGLESTRQGLLMI